uniref:Transposase zinc-ribbon domain-containing protein n=1 Tax=Trichuris muris TaxID=70415 RepID=A0A5S6QBC1_TRIMR
MPGIDALVAYEATPIRFLQGKGVLHRHRLCVCLERMSLTVNSARSPRWRCPNDACMKQMALRSGTWPEGSKLSFRETVKFLFGWSQQFSTITYCTSHVGIGKSAAIEWCSAVREVIVQKFRANPSAAHTEARCFRGFANSCGGNGCAPARAHSTKSLRKWPRFGRRNKT